MSVAVSVAVPRTQAHSRGAGGRMALLFAVLLVTGATSVGLSVVSALKPIGAGGDALPDYAALAPVRGYAWAFFTFAGVQMVVGVCAAALAAWILVPARGAGWATVGGGLVWLGAALYAVGIGGWAAVYYFGTDAGTLGPAAATRLIERYNDDAAHMLAVPIGGALLVMVGGLLISVALWRAGSVPRWVPIVGAISGVATVVIPPDAVPGVLAELASAVTINAIGWDVLEAHRGQRPGERPVRAPGGVRLPAGQPGVERGGVAEQ